MNKKRKLLIAVLLIIIAGYIIPEKYCMPVDGATKKDYNQKSFWFYPWGRSITHKGVDIFSKEGTKILSITKGIVLYSGTIDMGGNVVMILGPKWRLYYYAHLQSIKTSPFSLVSEHELIGTLGTTGNAIGKSPHLHFSILTILPYFWLMDNDKQGWKKMFYLNPIEFIQGNS